MIELTSGCIHHYRISRASFVAPAVYRDLLDIHIVLTSATKGLKDYAIRAAVTVTLDRRMLVKVFPANQGPFRLSEDGTRAMKEKINDFVSMAIKLLF